MTVFSLQFLVPKTSGCNDDHFSDWLRLLFLSAANICIAPAWWSLLSTNKKSSLESFHNWTLRLLSAFLLWKSLSAPWQLLCSLKLGNLCSWPPSVSTDNAPPCPYKTTNLRMKAKQIVSLDTGWYLFWEIQKSWVIWTKSLNYNCYSIHRSPVDFFLRRKYLFSCFLSRDFKFQVQSQTFWYTSVESTVSYC